MHCSRTWWRPGLSMRKPSLQKIWILFERQNNPKQLQEQILKRFWREHYLGLLRVETRWRLGPVTLCRARNFVGLGTKCLVFEQKHAKTTGMEICEDCHAFDGSCFFFDGNWFCRSQSPRAKIGILLPIITNRGKTCEDCGKLQPFYKIICLGITEIKIGRLEKTGQRSRVWRCLPSFFSAGWPRPSHLSVGHPATIGFWKMELPTWSCPCLYKFFVFWNLWAKIVEIGHGHPARPTCQRGTVLCLGRLVMAIVHQGAKNRWLELFSIQNALSLSRGCRFMAAVLCRMSSQILENLFFGGFRAEASQAYSYNM